MSEPEIWPTSSPTANNIPGELAWPEGAIRDAAVQCNNPWAWAEVGQGQNFMRFQKSTFLGLRGTFAATRRGNIKENYSNVSSLRIYRLWEFIGFVSSADGLGDEGQRDTMFQSQSRVGAGVVVRELKDRRDQFFYDGFSKTDDGFPILTRYYQDAQGQGTMFNRTMVNQGFYEMRTDQPLAKDEAHEVGALATAPGSGGRVYDSRENLDARMAATKGAGSGLSQSFQTDSLRDVYPILQMQEDVTPTVVKGEGGIAATDKAYSGLMAEDLAYARLVRATSDPAKRGMSGTPLLSQYQTHRRGMLRAAGSALLNSSIGKTYSTNPDRMQSEINSNIRARLRDEGFADHWIDFFMTKENINTITPAGFEKRSDPALRGSGISGFDSGVLTTGILAGTDPAQIMAIQATPAVDSPFQPESSPSVRIVIRAPFGYIKPGGGAGGGGGTGVGDSFDRPQLVQWFPKNYKFATWTLRTLDTDTRAHEKYIFDYAPNEIQYQGLGAEWVEVPRTGDLPLVEFSKWSLMRVTMQFLIANTLVDDMGRPHPDGLVTGVYDKIEKLRTMAQRPFPVSALNIDQLLRVSMKRAMISGEPLEFVISDFSVTSMQRTIVEGSNEITSAQCSLTLQEIPIEAAFVTKFKRPKIAPPLATPDEAQTDAVLEVSLLGPLTSGANAGTHTGGFELDSDSSFAVGAGPTS